MKFFNNGTIDIGIDLGTAITLIIHEGKIVVNQPSIVAYDVVTNCVIAVGDQAMLMHEKTHGNLKTIRPLKNGVIADFSVAEMMIKHMVKLVSNRKKISFSRSFKMLICIPCSITEVEKRAVKDSALHAGAVQVYTIYEPLAAALGIGLDIEASSGNLIVDIGGGTTEIALIALSGIVIETSIRIGGDAFNTDIINYLKRNYNVLIGEKTAETIKIRVGAAVTDLEEEIEDLEIAGKDMLTGIPKLIKINYSEMAFALDKSIIKIEEAILKSLENSPPELSSDIFLNGIFISGGGALLRGLGKRISDKTKLKVTIANDPLTVVVRGTWIALSDIKKYRNVLMN